MACGKIGRELCDDELARHFLLRFLSIVQPATTAASQIATHRATNSGSTHEEHCGDGSLTIENAESLNPDKGISSTQQPTSTTDMSATTNDDSHMTENGSIYRYFNDYYVRLWVNVYSERFSKMPRVFSCPALNSYTK